MDSSERRVLVIFKRFIKRDLNKQFFAIRLPNCKNKRRREEEMRSDKYKQRIGLYDRNEILITWVGILVSLFAGVLFLYDSVLLFIERVNNEVVISIIEQGLFIVVAFSLLYGGLTYLVARLGYLKRIVVHKSISKEVLGKHFYGDRKMPSVAILVPSYKEDAHMIEQTLVSAALQEYPNKRVVLLIDDPPNPINDEDKKKLLETRRLPHRIEELLRIPRSKIDRDYQRFLIRKKRGKLNILYEIEKLSRIYLFVSKWFEKQANKYRVVDHTDRFYVNNILREHQRTYFKKAKDLELISKIKKGFSEIEVVREYRRLTSLFKVKISSFERKKYLNLSHEPNKAMNLNSYIGLLGKKFKEIKSEEGLLLKEVKGTKYDFFVEDADYIITLDADSLLLREYTMRLLYIMEQKGNERIAVIQTPYNYIHDSPKIIEHIAGATTDIQYIIHQGFTYFDATYWVGANALLRKSALFDIKETFEERGYKMNRFIQDRTVIEDTESTVDLIDKGWTLYNYPDQLAYSATPADFGSLIIQRRRWANGGLIILPKLLKYLFSGHKNMKKLGEGFMRYHYLTSIAAVSFGLLILFLFPFEDSIGSLWLPITAAPYFLLYGRDLVHTGYKISDLFRVYALNLMLLPVNLGGVLKSIEQAITKKKIPFGRTPKIKGRTSTSVLYILSEYLLFSYMLFAFFIDALSGRWTHAVFSLINGVFYFYAISVFIGWRESWEDLRTNFSSIFSKNR